MAAKNTRPNIYRESNLMFTLLFNVWINGRLQVQIMDVNYSISRLWIKLLMENKVVQHLCVETALQIEHDVDDFQHLIPAHAEQLMDVDHYLVALLTL